MNVLIRKFTFCVVGWTKVYKPKVTVKRVSMGVDCVNCLLIFNQFVNMFFFDGFPLHFRMKIAYFNQNNEIEARL